MAPTIWGLDLSEMKWSKFKSSYMFNTTYHLRRTKMIVYQIAMILCVVSESIGTDAISRYNEQQDSIQHLDPRSYVYNNDFIGIASFNIFMGILVATIFGSAFFFDLFWPERYETVAVRLSWKIAAVLTTVALLADAVAMTVSPLLALPPPPHTSVCTELIANASHRSSSQHANHTSRASTPRLRVCCIAKADIISRWYTAGTRVVLLV
jgi:hypothetical protein